MTRDLTANNGEGSFGGALSFPWWEVAGRLVIGLWLCLPGLLGIMGGAWQFSNSDRLVLTAVVAAGAFGCLQLLSGILSFRGRFGLSGTLLVLSLAISLSWLFAPHGGPSMPEVAAKSPFIVAVTTLLLAAEVVWILGRRLARSRDLVPIQKATSVVLAILFVISIPALGEGMGRAIGVMLSPPLVAGRTVAGQRLPRREIRALDGGSVQLEEPGVVYVVNFWATWCGPCRKELPKLLALSRSWPKEAPVRLVAVNAENLDREAMGSFLEREHLSGLPVYLDPEGLETSLGYGAIPLTFVLKDGTILAIHNGYSVEIMSSLSEEIRRALGDQPRPAR
jgi:thiol-disulfide isomerase/thioredoxin